MDDMPAEERARWAHEAKRALRSHLGRLRRALPAPAVAARSAAVVGRLRELEAYQRSRGVALYAALPGQGEVDLASLDAEARAAGKRVYYPFLDLPRRELPGRAGSPRGARLGQPTSADDGAVVATTGFRLTASAGDLAVRGQKFAEPFASAPVAEADDLDLIVVPALGASLDGARVGFGSGFYDATLPDHPSAVKVIVVFDFQLLAELPEEPHDVRCDLVVTDLRVSRATARPA